MAVKLRLRRQGRTHTPHYQIVAADARSPRDGRFIEKIGTYDPTKEPAQVNLNTELALKWMLDGAQPTETVRSILSKEGVLLKLNLKKRGKSDEEIQVAFDKWKQEAEKRKNSETKELVSAKESKKAAQLASEKEKRKKIEAKIAAKNTVQETESTETEA